MVVVSVNNVNKKFKIYHDKNRSFKERVLFKKRNNYEERYALKNITFQVEKGEAIGLIGENGCGKSTLLKLMSKIMFPDQGTIEIKGRISSLIELGAGFHPDMSGRENIYTNAAIFGLTRKEIDERVEQIIEFSELENFIDNPVRTYSSGMYMRLAFSVAINVDADVLLIDEILAVGDANFQAKCFEHLRQLKADGVTIIIVTHDTGTVERFCSKAIWIENGNIRRYGQAITVVDSYRRFMSDKRLENKEHEAAKHLLEEVSIIKKEEQKFENDDIGNQEEIDDNHFGLKYIEITNAIIQNTNSQKRGVIRSGDSVTIEIRYKVNKPLLEYNFGMGLYTLEKQCIMGTNTLIDGIKVPHTKETGIVKFEIPKFQLLSGTYILQVAIVDMDDVPLDFYRDYCHFEVISDDRAMGMVSLEHRWVVNEQV